MDPPHPSEGLKTKRKVRFINFIRPEDLNKYMSALSTQEAFGTFQWMVRTGKGIPGVYEALSGQPTCINFREVNGFGKDWKQDLKYRFQIVLLSSLVEGRVGDWKAENGIELYEVHNGKLRAKERVIHFKHYPSRYIRYIAEGDPNKSIDALLDTVGRETRESHNSCHPDARFIQTASIYVQPRTFELRMTYGYKNDSSSWQLSYQSEDDEALFDFVRKAHEHCEQLLLPKE